MTTPNIEELRLLAQTLEFSDAVRCSIQRAADLLQSQAERIKEFEASRISLLEHTELILERDTLRDQLAEIDATEPVATINDLSNSRMFTLEANGYSRKDKLFTHPMPAQDVTELVKALEKLARLGNGEHYGNSDGNMIARDALSKYKGAK